MSCAATATPISRISRRALAEASARPAPHLVLVGLPGSGKSTVGRVVAERLGRPFLDFDREIERREGESVARLFVSRGEPWFREQERALTRELTSQHRMVLAPGGGWIANPGCLDTLKNCAVLVYLAVSPEIALARMGAEREARPLLDRADPLAALQKLAADRETAYLQSKHVVSTDLMSLDQVADAIVALAGDGNPD